jgi:hypothetical protein
VREKLAILSALLLLAAAVAGSGTPALSLGWYGGGACDDAAAQNPGASGGCRYDARERDCGNGVDDDSDEAADCADPDCADASRCVALGDRAASAASASDGTCTTDWWNVFLPQCPRCEPSEVDGDGDCARDDETWLDADSCADGSDAEGDGLTDCADPDCDGDAACAGGGSSAAADETSPDPDGTGALGASPSDTAPSDGAGQPSPNPDPANPDCAVDGAYDPFNTCHDHANRFCDEAPAGADARVVQCGSIGQSGQIAIDSAGQIVENYSYRSVADEIAGHTVNLYRRSQANSEWCVVEPQSGRECCFTDYACSADDVDLGGGPGASCAADICGEQYHPDACGPLALGERASSLAQKVQECGERSSRMSCLACCENLIDGQVRDWNELWLDTAQRSECQFTEIIAEAQEACYSGCKDLPTRPGTEKFEEDFSEFLD